MWQLLPSHTGCGWVKANHFFDFPTRLQVTLAKFRISTILFLLLGVGSRGWMKSDLGRQFSPGKTGPGHIPGVAIGKEMFVICAPSHRTLTLFGAAMRLVKNPPQTPLQLNWPHDSTRWSRSLWAGLLGELTGASCLFLLRPSSHFPAWVEEPHLKDVRTEGWKAPGPPMTP